MSFGVFGTGGIHAAFGDYQSANDAARASNEALNAEEHAKQTEARLDRAMLVVQAMWDLLRDKTGLEEQALLDQVNLRAQRKTELMQSPEALKCPKCGRPMGSRLAKCMYCGAPRAIETVFDAV